MVVGNSRGTQVGPYCGTVASGKGLGSQKIELKGGE